MERREMIGALGLGAAGLLALGETAQAQYKSRLNKMHVDCLNACTECAAVCNEAAHHCLEKLEQGTEHRHHHARSHHLTMDCEAICQVSASLVARQSPLADVQCQACAEACRRCAEECERDPDADEIMKECARICSRCEKSCREMARSAAGSR